MLSFSRWLALFLCVGTAWGIFLANQGDILTVRQFSRHVPGGDAGLHVAVMGTLTLVLGIAFSDAHFFRYRVGFSGILGLMLVFATLEEWQQRLQPFRRFSLRDLLFSYVGIALGALAWLLWRRLVARLREDERE
ncbi:MAG: hypothetical protein VX252_08715 [Myxococcota bacterium]|nr:hypothetical protein [Myxococcota bacterium]